MDMVREYRAVRGKNLDGRNGVHIFASLSLEGDWSDRLEWSSFIELPTTILGNEIAYSDNDLYRIAVAVYAPVLAHYYGDQKMTSAVKWKDVDLAGWINRTPPANKTEKSLSVEEYKASFFGVSSVSGTIEGKYTPEDITFIDQGLIEKACDNQPQQAKKNNPFYPD